MARADRFTYLVVAVCMGYFLAHLIIAAIHDLGWLPFVAATLSVAIFAGWQWLRRRRCSW